MELDDIRTGEYWILIKVSLTSLVKSPGDESGGILVITWTLLIPSIIHSSTEVDGLERRQHSET